MSTTIESREEQQIEPTPGRSAMAQGGICVALGVAAAVVAFVVHETVPNDVESLWSFLLALLPFFLAAEAVAGFPHAWAKKWFVAPLLVVVVFTVVMGVFAPLMFGRFVEGDFDGFYGLMRMLMPFLILALVFALRLGGGTAGQIRRAAYASLLIMLSGLEDLMFSVWRGDEIPDQWEWAEHITVRLGHVASQNEAFVFIGVHLLLALAILCVPVPKRAGRRSS